MYDNVGNQKLLYTYYFCLQLGGQFHNDFTCYKEFYKFVKQKHKFVIQDQLFGNPPFLLFMVEPNLQNMVIKMMFAASTVPHSPYLVITSKLQVRVTGQWPVKLLGICKMILKWAPVAILQHRITFRPISSSARVRVEDLLLRVWDSSPFIT